MRRSARSWRGRWDDRRRAAAAQRGLHVPQDLTITGWDDLPEARRSGLTTIGQPLAGKGQMAGELLIELTATRSPRRVILPTSIEIRRTSGRPPPLARA